MKALTSEQMRAVDAHAIQRMGVPGLTLMENAGRGIVRLMEGHLGPLKGRKIVVVCGKGNNGGDGFVVARLAKASGATIRLFLVPPASELKGDAKTNLNRWKKAGGKVEPLGERFAKALEDSEIIVDALFGTGLTQALKDPYLKVVKSINVAHRAVVSVDIPSGVNGTTGEVMGAAVRATMTVALGLPKLGHLLFPGTEYAGRIIVTDIGLPEPSMNEVSSSVEMITREEVSQRIPKRAFASHKGTYGHLLVIGGSRSKIGAVGLAIRSSLRCGVGLVTAAVPESVEQTCHVFCMEAMTIGLPESKGEVRRDAAQEMVTACDKRDAIVLGPGLGSSDETSAFVRQILAGVTKPVVLDADGLNAVSGDLKVLEDRAYPTILTPHPGEMARLVGVTAAEVGTDRMGAARSLSKQLGVHVVLKGARTVVAAPDGTVHVNVTGNPGMATAGTGDVLAGTIGALLAQGVGPLESARAGVFLHGRAGDLAAGIKGEASLIAGDLIEALPGAFLELDHGTGS